MKSVKRLSVYFGVACGIGTMAVGASVAKASYVSVLNAGGYPSPLPSSVHIATSVDPDTTLRTGQLENGLTYYVRTHQSPEKEATLKLIVKAGSLQEDDDQIGYAHFVEHMAFNGTKSFHKREIIDYLESIGLKFGADVNAYTAYDRTVYELTIPTSKPEYIETALKILSEWAGAITFDSAEVVAERGVIVEEWRGRQSRGADLMAHHDSVLNAGSRYLTRTPLGTYESIARAEPAGLKRFYKDWYRPNLMAVILVGDVNSSVAESDIKKLFSGLKNPVPERKIEAYSIPFVDTVMISVAKDSLINNPSISYLIRFNKLTGAMEKLAREEITFSMFTSAMNDRLRKLSRSIDAPFRGASVGGRSALDGTVYMSFEVVGRQASPLNSLETLLSEVERIAKFGLDTVEMDRIKSSMLRGIDQVTKKPPKYTSGGLASAYAAMFTDGRKNDAPDSALQLRRKLIPTITQKEIKEIAALWKVKDNRYFLLNLPGVYDVAIPEKESLLSVLEGIEYLPLTAYKEEKEEGGGTFVGEIPEPGLILQKIEHSDSIQEWRLSNGIKVWLRQTPRTLPETQIYGRSKGGAYSSVPKFGLIPSLTVEQTVGVSGAGGFSSEQLGKMVGPRDIYQAEWHISPYDETIFVSAANGDLPTALQLIHLFLKEPRIDTTLLEKEKARVKEASANRKKTPESLFHDTVRLVMAQHHPYIVGMMNATPDSFDPETSLKVFKDRFGDMSDFEFVITGNFDYGIMDTIVRTYIASFPGGGRIESYPDVKIFPADGYVKKRIYGAKSASAMTIMNFSGDLKPTREATWELTLLTEVIRTRLTQVLREELGGVYSPIVRSGFGQVPAPRFSLEISFASDPHRADELVDATLKALKGMQDSLVAEMYVAGVKAMMINSKEAQNKDLKMWPTKIMTMLDYGVPFTELYNMDWFEQVTPETVRQAARTLLDLKSYKLFQLFPGDPEQ